MRTVPLRDVRAAAADAGDWQMVALGITADSRTVKWPRVLVEELFRIAIKKELEDVDVKKVMQCLDKLDGANA